MMLAFTLIVVIIAYLVLRRSESGRRARGGLPRRVDGGPRAARERNAFATPIVASEVTPAT